MALGSTELLTELSNRRIF